MKIGAYLISFLIGSFFVQGQTLNHDLISDFGNFTGLKITDIKQDKTGFLWIATDEGLYRYNGYDFKLYEPKDKAIGSSVIQTLYLDSQAELWIGSRGGLFKYNENRDQLITFKHEPNNRKSIGGNIINSIVEDGDHNIWIALSKGGLDFLNRKDNVFFHFLNEDGSGLLSDDISDLHIDQANNLWVSTWDYGINKLDLKDPKNKIPALAKFTSYTLPDKFPAKSVINFIFEDLRSGKLYVGTNNNGLFIHDKNSDDFRSLAIPPLTSQYGLTPFSTNKAWLSTERGIFLINLDLPAVEICPKPLSEIQERVNVVFVDKQNITWVGANSGLIKNVVKKIDHYRLDEMKNVTAINNILSLCKQDQYLWIGTWGEGLHLKDEKNGKVIRINSDNSLLKYIWDIKLVNNNYLLVATLDGLVSLRVNQLIFKNSFPEKDLASQNSVTSLSKNTTGDTWVGTWRDGIYRVDDETGAMEKFNCPAAEGHYIQAVCLDSKNQLWIGTRHSGLIRLSNLEGTIRSKIYSERDPSNMISSDFVSSIYEDKTGRLWIGTGGGGINILDLKTEKIEWILKGEHNLPSNTVKAISEDNNGNIWVSFKYGISRYDPDNGFINYTQDDGLEFMDFNYNSVLVSDSLMYFGNQDGYNSFRPSELKFQESVPQVFITDFKINNKVVSPGERDEFGNMIHKPIYASETLTLNHKASNISFEFSSLDYTNPKREIYAYKLEGLSNDWTHTNAFNRQVTYSNLSPGKYVFKVKVIRDNMKANDEGKALEINIIPPFWQTTWFKITTFLILVGLIYAGHWIRLTGIRKQKVKFEKLADERIKVIEKKNIEIQEQAARLHEADQSKLIFFANISHEFRTPLMLIIGPLTSLLENNQLQFENEKLTMIHRNAQRLLRLMDQIMDITKIDSGSLRLELAEGDIIKFIKDIASSFDYLANQKKIQFEFKSETPGYQGFFDHDKIEKIFYNLLSNAFKVTPQYGLISLNLELTNDVTNAHPTIRIEIFNTGIGISKEELPNLFTRFYRTRNYTDGTGIGLSLTKSLVEFQGGKIDVTSEEKIGTTFYVTIPLANAASENESVEQYQAPVFKEHAPQYVHPAYPQSLSPIKRSLDPNAKIILILDDDEDMRTFISQLLEPWYTVVKASNGEDAVKLAYQFQPDLIISDMIMPVMDGYQFMRAIKGDTNVSHIPIILLTAKVSVEARLQGLEEGADDYITKPFNEKILLARVKNLIEQQRRMKERFSTDIHLKPTEITITSLDEKFMQRLIDVVEANMDDPDFGSDLICQELGIGRSYLYSKVKALTDLSVNEFIKTLRLKRAAILLLSRKQNVNEVANSVGFTDRSHFSKSFTKHFGVAPAQYQRQKFKSYPSL